MISKLNMQNHLKLFVMSSVLISCGGGGGGSAPAALPTASASLTSTSSSIAVGSSITLSWSSANATSCTASGSWSGAKATSGTEELTLSIAGNSSFNIDCSGATDSASVEAYRLAAGVVVDGYISEAQIFIDENNNLIADGGENAGSSAIDGKFSIKYANGNLISKGGIDADSQTTLEDLILIHKLDGHSDFIAVTPITTIAFSMENPSQINTLLGIDTSIDVFSFDPVANKGDAGINDFVYEKGNQLTILALSLANIANTNKGQTNSTEDFFKAISEEMEKEYALTQSSVNIESGTFIDKVLTNVVAAKELTITNEVKSQSLSVLARTLPVIQIKQNDNSTTALVRFGLTTMQTDIVSIANGSATSSLLASYESDIVNYISADQGISASEIDRSVSAFIDSITTAEDSTIAIPVLSNDSLNLSLPYTLTVSDGTYGSAVALLDQVSYTPNLNYAGEDSFSYTLTQSGVSSSASVNVTISPVNDAPTFEKTLFNIDENSTEVLEIPTTDPDQGDTLSLGLASDNDGSLFNLANNTLTFKSAPDFETKSSYSVNLSLTDTIEEVIQEVTININNLREFAPTLISPVSYSVEEITTKVIGTLSAEDLDGDEVTISISGADAASFELTTSNVLSLLEYADFETKNSYQVTINLTDGLESTAQDITVAITDASESAPRLTSPLIYAVEENTLNVGTLSYTDSDNDAVSYSIGGPDASSFSLAGDVLSFVSAPDYEVKTSYNISLILDDGTETSSYNLAISVNDLNEFFPVLSSPTAYTILENTTSVGSIAATDGDGDTIAITLGGTDAASFNLSGSNNLTFSEAPDYETKASYSITLTLTTPFQAVTQELVIAIENIPNEGAPIMTSPSTFAISESVETVGNITVSDVDGDPVTVALSGSDAGEFYLVANAQPGASGGSGLVGLSGAPQLIGNATSVSDYTLKLISRSDYEYRDSYSVDITSSDGTSSNTQTISVNVNDNASDLSCDQSTVTDAAANEFTYCWGENVAAPEGLEYSINPVSPLTVEFLGTDVAVTDSSFAEGIFLQYGIVLSDAGGRAWTNAETYALNETLKTIPQSTFSSSNKASAKSVWTITDAFITDDISITTNGAVKEVNISSSAFENATPRIVKVEGRRGVLFSKKLHHAAVRYVTNNGTNDSAINNILTNRFALSRNPNYTTLTANTTAEGSSRFQAFKPSEIVEIINMFEEMPKGMHKISGFNYIIRRADGVPHPLYPDAAAVAWTGPGYIEFMSSAFGGGSESIDTHRLILHEKSHFLWAKIYDQKLKDDWAALSGWNQDADGNWTATSQTQFASPYAHDKNPNEDMAESFAFFIVNPDILRSQAPTKYEFIRDRIMQGTTYIAKIREDLTFEVLNLFPDYVYPGKIKRVNISVTGAPEEDKKLTVDIELHTIFADMEGAKKGYTRISSEQGTFFDMYFYPVNPDENGTSTILRGTKTISKYAAKGFWKAKNISITDQVGNTRNNSANDYGWRMWVNNPLEDLEAPVYQAESATFTQIANRTIEGIDTDMYNASWIVSDTSPLGQCRGVINDENLLTSARQLDGGRTNNGDGTHTCSMDIKMPYYFYSGKWHLSYVRTVDLAGNNRSVHFFTSNDLEDQYQNNARADETAKFVEVTTSDPDTTPPELDITLGNISVSAAPTNPAAPNGETIVTLNYKTYDDISGLQNGSVNLRDPNGKNHHFWLYPSGGSNTYPAAGTIGVWEDKVFTMLLPAGSAPGTWGVAEISLIDRAGNVKAFNFTEILTFIPDL